MWWIFQIRKLHQRILLLSSLVHWVPLVKDVVINSLTRAAYGFIFTIGRLISAS
jgi:hypothetical protein